MGSFFVFALPLSLLTLIPNFVGWVPYAALFEAVCLGTTHFFITLAVYLRAENLDYFRSSRRNALVYLCVPLLIFAFFAGSEATRLWARFPLVAPYFLAFVRLCDFFHVGRQSAGMLQIWKRGAQLPSWLRWGEQALFVGLACLQWETFLLGGRFRADDLRAALPAIALGVLLTALVGAHVAGLARAAGERARWMPLAYLALQATCAASAAYDTRLYLAALAMHYAEYHAIMAPRLFRTPLWPARRIDRVFGVLRERVWVFYAVLLSIVVAFELRSYVRTTSPAAVFLVHTFDGVFLVHYFLEAFLWKFRNPHYRTTLAPLYFEPVPRVVKAPSPRPISVGGWAGALLMAALLLSTAPRWWTASAASFERRAIEPMHATNHLHWGVQLAERGELRAARAHFAEAARHDPEDPQAKRLLEWLDAHLER